MSNVYTVPEKYAFRIHHVRSRFKNDVENVLMYFADEISNLGIHESSEFKTKLMNALWCFPGNADKTKKTMDNWRTEISTFFGFVLEKDGFAEPGRRAVELSTRRDLIEFFKTFLFTFQYPGAHIKPERVKEQIENGVNFKPAQYILAILRYANAEEKRSIGLTKAEICHCIFNDLRCTRDNEDPSITWSRIKQNRLNKVKYDETGDIIRYAGDIVDYMVIANLLKTYDNRSFYVNSLEEESIIKFINSDEWFDEYDEMIGNKKASLEDIKLCEEEWFNYVNQDLSDTDFGTDILSYLTPADNASVSDEEDVKTLRELIISRLYGGNGFANTKDIGDVGETLIVHHEKLRLKYGGRDDLVHLVMKIPTQYAVGYDVSSRELDDKIRHIEVKTTLTSKPLQFNKIHLTPNEWNAAETNKESYYIYRLGLSRSECRLFLLQDPVGLYKKDLITMTPGNGVDISFDVQNVGHFEELLSWQK